MAVEEARRQEFEELAFEHLDAATRFARSLAREEAEGQDLVQDSYLRAYRFFDQYETGTNFKAWLFRILRNTFINDYRKRRRRPTLVELTGTETSSDVPVLSSSFSSSDASPDTGDVLLREELVRALGETPETFREVVVACLVDGRSYKEVAESLGVPIGTVMSRLYRGRRHLQGVLSTQACEAGLLASC